MEQAQEKVVYPYLPKDREILYVTLDNEFMKEATRMLQTSGCVKQPTAAVIVKNGAIIGRGVNAGKRIEICPRVVHNCPTGTGYEFCKTVCQQEGHAEVMAVHDAVTNENHIAGADLYLDGHWWCCEPCWNKMIDAGINRVFLRIDSIELYKK